MKKLATELVKGDRVKHGNCVGIVIGVNEKYSSKYICYDVETEPCVVKRINSIYKPTVYEGGKTTMYFRKSTLVEVL